MEFNQDSSLNPVLDEFSRDSRLSRSCGQLDSRLNSVLDDSLRDSRLISSCVQQDSRLTSFLDEFSRDSNPFSSCMQRQFSADPPYLNGSSDLSIFADASSVTPNLANLVDNASSFSSHDLCSLGFPSSFPVPSCSSSDFVGDSQLFVSLHQRVHAAGLPNFRGARLAVPTSLNIPLWRSLLSEYTDVGVCDFLEFGWPIGYDYRGALPSSVFRNHRGAIDFPSAVDSYLSTELRLGSVCGPFARNPFSSPYAVSPLNSVPKQGSDERRFILDLSWPEGSSVNDGICKDFYLGEPVNLTYPTVDDIAERIVQFGPGCLLFKRDLKRAYRQLPVDPYDYPLLGYSWGDQLFFDVRLPMGLRSAAMACQRVTNSVCFMLSQAGCFALSYLDDFMGISTPPDADRHFELSGSLLQALGLQESSQKVCPPSTQMICLGVLFDTVNLTMSVTSARLRELQDAVLPQWLVKKSATKTELQSLIGKLAFVCKCVRPGRLFLSRLLDTLRSLRRPRHRVRLTADFRKDIRWWLRFLSVYNGVSFIPNQLWSSPDSVFSTDACLTGCGGLSTSEFFHVEFPPSVLARFPAIHLLEALAIVVALRLWGRHWRGLRIFVYCDNSAVVSSLNSGRVQDKLLASCLREIWFLAAINEFELRACHITGVDNRGADLLSRWHLSSASRDEFLSRFGDLGLQFVSVPMEFFQLSDSC